jgi:hypothetical protein
MADISITSTLVVAGTGARIDRGIAGVAITAGQAVYLDATTGKYGLADTDSATAGVRAAIGVALNGASLNQTIAVCTGGLVTMGATLVAGSPYYLSGDPGGICLIADVLAGDYPCIIGVATTTGILNVGVVYPGVVKV